MIAFASLFIGLVVGIHPVELLVGDSVAYAEIVLNDRAVGYLGGDPWRMEVDFGTELKPHELVAVGYDSDRKEVARIRQWVNLPRQPAEATIVLQGGNEGRGVTARLAWNSVVEENPRSVSVSFDGQLLAVTDPRSIVLPDYDPETLHFVRAELDFSDTLSSLAEITFGGAYADDVSTELTAVPVLLEETAKLAGPESLVSVSRRSSRPLSIVAVEKGPAELLVVLDDGAREALSRFGRLNSRDLKILIDQEEARMVGDLWRGNRQSRTNQNLTGSFQKVNRSSLREMARLRADLRLRFLQPFAERKQQHGSEVDIFLPSGKFTAEDGGLYWILILAKLSTESLGPQRLADAVASASVLVARRNRRRAVLLVLGEEPQDASVLRPSQVEQFLTSLRVPLVVWSTGTGEGQFFQEWRSVTRISSISELDRAAKRLFGQLDRQRIVWVDGVHLPQDIVIRSADSEFSLAQ